MEGRKKMAEIKLVKKYPNIRDEDVIEIFQEGYLKGFENGRKNAIPIEWIKKKCNEADNIGMGIDDWSVKDCYELVLEDWEKENGNID